MKTRTRQRTSAVFLIAILAAGTSVAALAAPAPPGPGPAPGGAAPAQPAAPAADPAVRLASDDEQVVVVIGVGATAADAHKDALRAAVFRVVGGIVDAETLVKNDQIVRDQVLTASDGTVARAETVGQARKRADGLIEVTVKAAVRRVEVTRRLAVAKIIPVDAAGVPVALQEGANREEAKKILERYLPLVRKQALTARVIDDQGTATGKPTRIFSERGDAAEVAWNIEVNYDDNLFREASRRLATLLNAVTDEKTRGAVAVRTPVLGTAGGKRMLWGNGRLLRWFRENNTTLAEPLPAIPERHFLVLLDQGNGRDKQNRTFNWYLLDKETYYPMFKAMQQPAAVELTLIGATGAELARHRLPLDRTLLRRYAPQENEEPHPSYKIRVEEQKVRRTLLGSRSGVNPDRHTPVTEWIEAIVVTPEFFSETNTRSDGDWELPFVCDGLVLRYQTTLGAAEAKGIKELKLAFVDAVEE